MNDRSSQQRLAIVLIAAGLLWLFSALGIFPGGRLIAILTYWPLLLIGIGVDMLVRERVVLGLPYTVVAIILMVLLGLLAPSAGGGLVEERYNEPVGSAARAEIRLELGSAPTTVRRSNDPQTLFEADIRDRRRPAFEVRRQRDSTAITLAAAAGPGAVWFWFGPDGARWELGLGGAVPLALDIDAGSGSSAFELDGIQLEELRYDGGSGASRFVLPAGRYPAHFDTGSGGVRIHVLRGAETELDLDSGSGAVTVSLDPEVDAEVTLASGSGAVVLELPNNAAVRVEATDEGSGALRLPGRLERVSGRGDRGVWQTPNFGGAAQSIRIHIRDAGSGSIVVR